MRRGRRLYYTSAHSNSKPIQYRFVRHPWLDGRLNFIHSLDDNTRIITFAAAHASSGNLAGLIKDWAFLDTEKHAEGLEALLQNIAYSGIPKILNSLTTICEMGVTSRYVTPNRNDPPSVSDFVEYRMRGKEVLKKVYGNSYSKYRARMKKLHPQLDKWLLEFGYGRLRSRDTCLDQKTRQLSILLSIANNISFIQFRSMILGALNLGATVEEVRGVLDACELVWGVNSQTVVDALWVDLNKKKLYTIQNTFADTRNIKNTITPNDPNQVIKNNDTDDVVMDKVFAPLPEALRESTLANLVSRFRYVNNLPNWVRLLCLLAGHTASGNLTQVSKVWSLLPPTVDMHILGLEAILQTSLFAGQHRVVNALEVIHTTVGVIPEALSQSTSLEEEKRVSDPLTLRKSGEDLLKIIYRKQYEPLREKLRWMHPELDSIITDFAYGTVLSRPAPGLEVYHRELIALAAMSGQIVFPQFHSHLLGAIYAGASVDEVRGILDQTEEIWGRGQQNMVDGYWIDFIRHLKVVK
eukprot:TRINITY_DN6505_c0_g1_i1.p1 TRINITY_DN6505_c0_g1~~TRINITY_DN6505_c0_g1_i1.p1  ORF type:complete len:524 (-),score=80.48 TRINITY_DN6505_c0_g1_i1:78-1649(-)